MPLSNFQQTFDPGNEEVTWGESARQCHLVYKYINKCLLLGCINKRCFGDLDTAGVSCGSLCISKPVCKITVSQEMPNE